jgi:hypothetical protein
MRQRLWISSRCFESEIERVEDTVDGCIVKTLERRYFRLDPSSARLLRGLLARDRLDISGPLDAQRARFLTDRLLPLGIFRLEGDARPAPPPTATRGAMRWQRQVLPARVVGRVAAVLARLTPPAVLLALLALCVGMQAFYVAKMLPHVAYRDLIAIAPADLAWLALFGAARGLAHEFGHATACWRLTGTVGGIGCGVFVIAPVLWCDVSDVHLLSRRRKAIVGGAGTAADMIVLAALVACGGGAAIVAKLYALNLVAVALNLLPLYRNDGYWIVNDLAGGRDLLRDAARAVVAGRARTSDWAWVAFAGLCIAAAAALALGFALRLGPRQLADALRLLPESGGVMLLGVTLLQYAAVAFGAVSGGRAMARGWRALAGAMRPATTA